MSAIDPAELCRVAQLLYAAGRADALGQPFVTSDGLAQALIARARAAHDPAAPPEHAAPAWLILLQQTLPPFPDLTIRERGQCPE